MTNGQLAKVIKRRRGRVYVPVLAVDDITSVEAVKADVIWQLEQDPDAKAVWYIARSEGDWFALEPNH